MRYEPIGNPNNATRAPRAAGWTCVRCGRLSARYSRHWICVVVRAANNEILRAHSHLCARCSKPYRVLGALR